MQETIEICEALDMDPYHLKCGCGWIYATDDMRGIMSTGNSTGIKFITGTKTAADTEEATDTESGHGVITTAIGHITGEKARLLHKRKTDMYLSKPQ